MKKLIVLTLLGLGVVAPAFAEENSGPTEGIMCQSDHNYKEVINDDQEKSVEKGAIRN